MVDARHRSRAFDRLLFIRTLRKLSPASNRRLRHRTGSADPRPAQSGWDSIRIGPRRSRARCRVTPSTYRRWGISPRPEDAIGNAGQAGLCSLAPTLGLSRGTRGMQCSPLRTVHAQRAQSQSPVVADLTLLDRTQLPALGHVAQCGQVQQRPPTVAEPVCTCCAPTPPPASEFSHSGAVGMTGGSLAAIGE